MNKRLIVILALVFAVGFCFAAYAEVQNVKVSGDLAVTAMARNNFNLNENAKVSESMFLSQTRVKVDADLTDMVSATVRLINERNWDAETANTTDINLDLASVTLKEFLYSPLTVKVGRQEIAFGNKLIIGASNTYTNGSGSTLLNGVPSDLSLRKAFDAIRATLNYDPLVIDAVYSKIDETVLGTKNNQDTNLYGINASYALDKTTNVQGYIWDSKAHTFTANKPTNIYTLGGLVSTSKIENLLASLEYAYQFGNANAAQHKISAWALQAMANYAMPKVKMTPMIGLAYTYLSGDKNSGDNKYKTWTYMYEDQNSTNIANAILPPTDCQVFSLNGAIKPMADLKLSAVYAYYRLAQRVGSLTSQKLDTNGDVYLSAVSMNMESKDLGNGLDLTAAYDYTEDVQLGLTYGFFKPGKAFSDGYRENANQLVGSMKVTF
ncbi:MAG: alginate export family protein [Candidatus Omnitrophica bacterium]|jgi:hypothetical protein|nr:alginate export family protein [Candidatus Omnitrophota bacterium]